MIPLSALNHFLFCPRRAALIHIEGIFEENRHTILGDLAHEHADLPGYEVAKGVLLWRALPVWSERLGLSGKCDIVEVELGNVRAPPAAEGGAPSAFRSADTKKVFGEVGNSASEARAVYMKSLRPVEYKKGKRRQFDNDDAQLCAQAICLEEMFAITIDHGAIFHAESKRRREVEFTRELRALVEHSVAELHRLVLAQRVPPAVYKPACEECSLFEICLPKATAEKTVVARLAESLFKAN